MDISDLVAQKVSMVWLKQRLEYVKGTKTFEAEERDLRVVKLFDGNSILLLLEGSPPRAYGVLKRRDEESWDFQVFNPRFNWEKVYEFIKIPDKLRKFVKKRGVISVKLSNRQIKRKNSQYSKTYMKRKHNRKQGFY